MTNQPGLEVTEVRVPKTQKERILDALELAGELGVSNYTLNMICFRYGARLFDLKRDGYTILSKHTKGSEWRFILVRESVE